jgi:hypothetical protein
MYKTIFFIALIVACSAKVHKPFAKTSKADMSKVLAVRGGANVGPINSENLPYISAAMGVMYSMEMLLMSEDATKKYLKEPVANKFSAEMTKWFGLSLLQSSIMQYMVAKSGASEAVTKAMGIVWPMGLAFVLWRKSEGMFHDQIAVGINVAFSAVAAYLAFS